MLLSNRRLQFLYFSVLFEKLVEQHRVHRVVADGIDLAILIAQKNRSERKTVELSSSKKIPELWLPVPLEVRMKTYCWRDDGTLFVDCLTNPDAGLNVPGPFQLESSIRQWCTE
jgi:hypothetical protein